MSGKKKMVLRKRGLRLIQVWTWICFSTGSALNDVQHSPQPMHTFHLLLAPTFLVTILQRHAAPQSWIFTQPQQYLPSVSWGHQLEGLTHECENKESCSRVAVDQRYGCMIVWWLALFPHSKKIPSSNLHWGIPVWLKRAWIRATGLLLGSWRRFTSHPTGFFSSELDGGEYQLINREGRYSHVSLNPLTSVHVIRVIVTSELSACLGEFGHRIQGVNDWETASGGETMLHCRCWKGDTWDQLLCS